MESQGIVLFQPVRNVWHPLCNFRAKRISGPLVNGIKNRMIELSMAIVTIFAVIYSLITFPIRWYQAKRNEKFGVDNDLSRLSPAERIEAEGMVQAYFKKHKDIFGSMPKKKKDQITRVIISQCARSQKVYGPVVREWVDHLLEKANKDQKKLVFMARDGIPFYQVACQLMQKKEYREKYPHLLQEGAIVLGYFSRNAVASAKKSEEGQEIFRRYISEELKIKEGDQCIFVDIGFSGSMTKPIRELIPDAKIDFNFLVATSDKAEGYLGNPTNPLPNLETAANNLGVRWVEESHHGNVASATKLVVGEDNRVYPDTFYPKKTRFNPKFSEEYLIRKFTLKGLVKYAIELNPLSKPEAEKAKEIFSQTLGAIKAHQLPVFVGWDY
jgi:hypothetical protein